jgi:actin cytoskeleton-regulatory complex protein SLA1
MIALRVLLGIAMSGIYPSLTYLSQSGTCVGNSYSASPSSNGAKLPFVATGSIINFSPNHLAPLRPTEMAIDISHPRCHHHFLGLLTYFWMVDFPDNSQNSPQFLTPTEPASPSPESIPTAATLANPPHFTLPLFSSTSSTPNSMSFVPPSPLA